MHFKKKKQKKKTFWPAARLYAVSLMFIFTLTSAINNIHRWGRNEIVVSRANRLIVIITSLTSSTSANVDTAHCSAFVAIIYCRTLDAQFPRLPCDERDLKEKAFIFIFFI